MRRPHPARRNILFPWEARVGLRRWLLVTRLRSVVVIGAVVTLIVVVATRERHRAMVRRTHAALLDASTAVQAYLADHDGSCPSSLAQVAQYLKRGAVPVDAWGRPLRLICPSQLAGPGFRIMSDGPDGIAGGLDRVE